MLGVTGIVVVRAPTVVDVDPTVGADRIEDSPTDESLGQITAFPSLRGGGRDDLADAKHRRDHQCERGNEPTPDIAPLRGGGLVGEGHRMSFPSRGWENRSCPA